MTCPHGPTTLSMRIFSRKSAKERTISCISQAFKLFTTEETENRTYLEHEIKQTDIKDSDCAVQQTFQTVGGLAERQEPFLVALTSAGYLQFTLFELAAGTMEDLFQVKTTEDISSLPQRVVTTLKNKILGLKEVKEQDKQNGAFVGGTSGAVVVVSLLVIGVLFWRCRRDDLDKQRTNHLNPAANGRKAALLYLSGSYK
ncbi:hypothetical protein BG015_010104 [Linnemannia schmuckeri]|uniref:Uncharacterized protein n=1 Tax=Linnemannia schmuckeri TaxID=64567 RepID=A0A9P5S7E8_9FUNG|nr:hypothetical protein BG015_010104 [Linnemannia schmuckeri]